MNTNEKKIRIGDIFKEQFSFGRDGFMEPLVWDDGNGISRLKKGESSYSSLYKIGINEDEQDKNSSLKKVSISVSHGREVNGGVVLGESGDSGLIDLYSRDEFSYDLNNEKFYYGSQEITSAGILARIQKVHEKPSSITRFRLRFWHTLFPAFIAFVDARFIDMLWFMTGEERGERDIMVRLLGTIGNDRVDKTAKGPYQENLNPEENKQVKFFIFKASYWSVAFYLGLNLLIYFALWFENIDTSWMCMSSTRSISVFVYVVLTFPITEAVIPAFLRWSIEKKLPEIYGNAAFKSLKIKI